MASNPLKRLQDEGVSVWLDYLDRNLMDSGRLQRLIDEDGIRGETSNPTIFQMGVSKGVEYAEDIRRLAADGRSTEEICWEIMIGDVRRACDIFRPLYDESDGAHGYVSLELNPTFAHKTAESLVQGRELWKKVGRPNLMLKVPGTEEGLPVIEELLAEGMNVNVTLLFAVSRYEEVMSAFFRGLRRQIGEGKPVDRIASVASFFVSRVDSEADKRLKAAGRTDLCGRVAVANSRLAYRAFEERFAGRDWKELEAAGARIQNPLWASTSTKDPSYSDILYVQDLIGPHCVNTMPDDTIDAYRDHGTPERTLTDATIADAKAVLGELAEAGIDIDDITMNTLVPDGVRKFEKSYYDLLETIEREAEG
ncbi:MAG: transaldolase [Candidatus Eisenbacteria bacterium]